MPKTIEHKCKECGASLLFDSDIQKMLCPYCGTALDVEDTRKDDGDLRPKKKRSKKTSSKRTCEDTEWSNEELEYMSEYQCRSCGGDLYTTDTTSATLCPYCGNAVMLRGHLSGVLKPRDVIPFQISKEQALKGLDDFIAGKHFVHRDFLDRHKLEEVKGLYVPFWVFDADVIGDITFDCVNERVWTEGDYEYTERKYYRARRKGCLNFVNVPVDASTKVSDELMESIEPYDCSMVKSFTTGYLSGFVADKYDISKESARPRAEQRMIKSTESALKSTVHYDEVSISDSDYEVEHPRSKYSLYPVWLISSVWKDDTFIFAMNGQTGKTVGNLPPNWSRLLLTAALIIAAFTGMFTAFSISDDGKIFWPFPFIGFIIGVCLAGFTVHWYRKELITVRPNNYASRYHYGLDLWEKEDEYLYKKVTRRKINNNNDNNYGGNFNQGF